MPPEPCESEEGPIRPNDSVVSVLPRKRGATPVPRESGNEGEHDVYSNQYDC